MTFFYLERLEREKLSGTDMDITFVQNDLRDKIKLFKTKTTKSAAVHSFDFKPTKLKQKQSKELWINQVHEPFYPILSILWRELKGEDGVLT